MHIHFGGITRAALMVTAATLLTSLGATVTIGYLRLAQPAGAATLRDVTAMVPSELPADTIPWPASSQASIGTVENGIMASKPNQVAKPTASTAKLITVLTVLKARPLAPGESGPLMTIDEQDMRIYDHYHALNGSLVPVQLGEQLTQYQMLQGILIRSANNLADKLALWAFGSLDAYQKAAQAFVSELGMTSTTVGSDASGLDPSTVSTAEDLTRLSIAAMKNPVVREIVGQTALTLPVGGTMPNTNWLLGTDGVIGIKTGNSIEAGGVFVIAGSHAVPGEKPLTLVAAVQEEPTTADAIIEAKQLMESVKPLFSRRTVVKANDKLATIVTPWGERADALSASDISVFGWNYTPTRLTVNLQKQPPFQKGEVIGSVSVDGQSSPLIASETLRGPTWQWRVATKR